MQIVQTRTASGLRYHGLLSEPADSTKKIIIHIHGMAGTLFQENYYPTMHSYYPTHGISFLTVEHRGTGTITEFDLNGGTKVIGNAYELFEDCIEDIKAWVDYAASLGYSEIWLQGHSLGTSKVAYYTKQTKDERIAGLILLSPSDMVGLVHDELGQKDHDLLYPEAKQLVQSGKGDALLSNKLWGSVTISAQTYLNFFEDSSQDAIFNYANESLGWRVVNEIKVPVVAMTGTNDDGIEPVMDPNQAMEKLHSELKNSPRIKTVVYEGAQHNFEGFDKEIVNDVVEFIQTDK